MAKLQFIFIGSLAALAVGCVAHIDSSASSKLEDDAGAAGSAAPMRPMGKPSKPAASDDDAGAPIVSKPAAKPPVDDDDDDAGRAIVAMPMAGSASPSKADASVPDAAVPDAAVACDFRGLVSTKCSGAACHGGPAAGTGLDLTSAMLATRVEGRMGPAACSSNLLIDKTNPAKSALYLKVTGTTCGSQMPLTGGTLSSTEKACVLSWIEGL